MQILRAIDRLAADIAEKSTDSALLVGISGIDASGKGYIAARLAEQLSCTLNVAVINVDGWLNLPHVRFSDNEPGLHFYEHALRLDEMFELLVRPLKCDRRIDITADYAEETSAELRPHRYLFENVDVILVEGIFLFKRQYLDHFDLKIWIECSFETALKRAAARSQEGLSVPETIRAYETTYFPAQRIHFDADQPQESADIVLINE